MYTSFSGAVLFFFGNIGLIFIPTLRRPPVKIPTLLPEKVLYRLAYIAALDSITHSGRLIGGAQAACADRIRLCAIENEGNVVVARFGDGSVERGDMLLAFDGVHSRARALILPDYASPRYTGFMGIGGFAEAGIAVPVHPLDAYGLSFSVGSRFQFGYAMVSGAPARWGWWTHLPQEQELTRAELQAVPDDVVRDRVLRAFKSWHSPIEALVWNTAKIMRTAIYDVPSLPRWHVDRVMLLGDAAHAMSPAGGQGASLALEDAMLVSRFLADGSGSITEAFAKAESVQRVRAERMVKQAAENDRRQVKELGPFGQWMRDRMFPLFAGVIGRELRRQYTALEHISVRAA